MKLLPILLYRPVVLDYAVVCLTCQVVRNRLNLLSSVQMKSLIKHRRIQL
jgi:hypothetical protein